MATKPSNNNLNGRDAKVLALLVFKKPLGLFSKQPMTGFYRDGYCRTGPEDSGNHAIAGLVTEEFLTFSAKQGNDLRSIGLTGGCKWCLCTARWKEAMLAAKSADDPVVPKVFLHATDESALTNGISMKDLEKFAAEGEVGTQRPGNPAQPAITPGDKAGSPVKEV
ncbi:hypothetical protein MMC25_003314 [Agyrium rufum]|nr:hypothetical protein [Agyrium rufum]